MNPAISLFPPRAISTQNSEARDSCPITVRVTSMGAAAAAVPARMPVPDDPEADEYFEPEHLASPDWVGLARRIREGEPSAMEDLYTYFSRGIRYFLLRNLGPADLDDKVHDCFLTVTQAIRNGELRDPNRLMGYVRTVVKRYVASCIDTAVQQRRSRVDFEETLFALSDWRDNPEDKSIALQRAEIARRVLNGISRRDREILRRFYVQEQSQERICTDMGLSYNQFRLLKSRAKARFGEMGRRVAEGLGMTFENPDGEKQK